MWFWIGLALVLLWGGWGYWRRRWWLRAIDRSLGSPHGALHYEPPSRLVVPDRIMMVIAGSAAIIGVFLVLGSRWGWFI